MVVSTNGADSLIRKTLPPVFRAQKNSSVRAAGLPDGLFSNPNPNFGKILDGLEMDSVGTYLYLKALWSVFTALWYILWSFYIFWVCLVYIVQFWYVVQMKIWQHWRTVASDFLKGETGREWYALWVRGKWPNFPAKMGKNEKK
jgi:hypothetical protein